MQWLLQTLLLGCTLLLALWVRLPAAALAGFGLAAAALLSPALAPQAVRARVEGAALAALWMGSLTVWVRWRGPASLGSFISPLWPD
jgi:hypothetical protein